MVRRISKPTTEAPQDPAVALAQAERAKRAAPSADPVQAYREALAKLTPEQRKAVEAEHRQAERSADRGSLVDMVEDNGKLTLEIALGSGKATDGKGRPIIAEIKLAGKDLGGFETSRGVVAVGYLNLYGPEPQAGK